MAQKKSEKTPKAGDEKAAGDATGIELSLVRSLQRYLLKTIATQSMDLLLRGAAVQNDCTDDWVLGLDTADAKAAPAAAAAGGAAAGPDMAAVRALTMKERSDIIKLLPAPIGKLLQQTMNKLGNDVGNAATAQPAAARAGSPVSSLCVLCSV